MCDGPTKTFTITVNPTGEVDQPASEVVCNGDNTTAVNFTTINTGGVTTYTWTNDNITIGLAASGNGDIPSFTAINNGTAPEVATIVVTPHFSNGGKMCDGPTKTFTITVNPTGEVDQPASEVVCNGDNTTAVNFTTINTGGVTTYTWTNDNITIGLAASGNGDIPSFTAINNGTAPEVATIVVTPHFSNGGKMCDGPTKTFTITVNPTGEVDQPASEVVCNGDNTTAVNFTTINTGGVTTYTWTNDNITIGLAASGNGDIPSFTAINNGTAPEVATIVVTPHFSNGGKMCDGPTKTFTITVNPTGEVDQPASEVVCNGDNTTAVNFTTINTGGVTTYTWTNDNITIGLAASGNGDIPSFTAINNGTAPEVATIVVTPHFSNGGKMCDGPTKTFTITVNPTGEVDQPASEVVCNGDNTTAVNFTTINTGGVTTYTWTNDNITIGLAASGNGDIPSFTAINNGTAPEIATIVVTPHFSNGGKMCDGPTKTFTITVNPTGEVDQPASEVVCNGDNTTAVNFTTINTGGVTTYTWTNDNITIGLAASGNGDIPSFTAINNGTAPEVATIVVTPHFSNGGKMCDGPTKTFTITVNPTGEVDQPASEVVCNGDNTTAVNFTTINTGGVTTYTWTNDNITIGLAASGNGDIPSFTAINNGTAPEIATIVVTPHFSNGGKMCDGPTKTFTITVNPTGEVDQPASEVVCNGDNTTAVNFTTINTGGVTTYTWTNDNITIGLAASGNGDIPSFTAINNGTAPEIATIVVTPHFSNGGKMCDGPTKTFTITVNPTGEVDQPASEVVCNGDNTTAVNFTTINTGGVTTYTWTNDNITIGLAASGNGDIPSFTAINNGTAPEIATIVVTPHFSNGGKMCDGPTKTFTITVNPTGEVDQPASEVVCNGDNTTAVNFTTINTGGVTTYTWTNDNITIGLAASGNGDIPSFTAINNGTAPEIATIVVTPHFSNGGKMCDGPTKTFTITVNPTGEVDQPASEVVCNGDNTTAVNFTTINTGGVTTYTWTNDNITIGLAASGNGDIPSFTAINNGTAPEVATIVVTPHFSNGGKMCDGPTKTFTITVNPTGEVDQPASEVVCNGDNTTAVNFTTINTGGVTTYTWTNDNITIGLAASGNGDIPSFTAINNGTAPEIATIVVTPHFSNGGKMCDGPTKTFTITVNPTGEVDQPVSEVVCNGDNTTAVNFTTINTGGVTTYTWTNDNITIGLAASGNGDIPSFTAINNGTAPEVATIVVTPHFSNGGKMCDGPTKTFTITVNPTGEVDQPASEVVCNGDNTTAVNFTTINTGGVTTYTWTNDNITIGLAASGNGDIPSFTAINNGTAPEIATIVVTPHFSNGGKMCDGPTKTFTITVNPTGEVDQPASEVVCNGDNTTAVNFTTINTGGVTTYTWTNDNITIGLAASGNGDIPSFTAINNGTAPEIATIVVTPHFSNGGKMCDGPTKTFTITVNPTGEVDQPASEVVCNGDNTTAVNFTTINTGGVTTYTWTNDNITIGLAASGNGDIPSFTAINNGTAPEVATIVVTPHFSNGGKMCDGPTKTFTITVNPTPEVIPSPMTQSICNDGTTNIILGSPSTFTSGVITFNYTVTATGGVTGFTTPVTGLPKDHIISDILHNPTDAPQTVTYTIVPISPTGCPPGPVKIVIITVDPTPQVIPSTLTQTICNDGTTNIALASPSTFISGVITFNYTVTATGGVTGFTTPVNGLPMDHVISDILHNPTDSPQTVTYTIVPISPRGCPAGPSKVITVIVDPTPQVIPDNLAQTICNDGTTNITLGSPSSFSTGVITFNYTVTATGGVTGFTTPVNGLPKDHVISDVLHNPTDSPQTVTYTITPISPNGCSAGPVKTVVITIDPTPQVVPSALAQRICNHRYHQYCTYQSQHILHGCHHL